MPPFDSRATIVPDDPLPTEEVTRIHVSRRPSSRAGGELAGASRYEPRATLGEGGMGRVVLGRDALIGRDVAIKSLLAAADEPATRARFLREARIQGQLDHPCVVPVYDLDPGAEGVPSFSMRYVRGESLRDVLRRLRAGDAWTAHRYSRRRLLTAFSSVCAAVHFAHTRGVLHRDLKPDNVMFGDFGEVYVLDWGIACVLDERDAPVHAPLPSEFHTEQGCVIGTPGFIPPEQWIGARLDARADVYGLGMLLFELLTHAPYHAGDSLAELMRSTFNHQVEAPSSRRPDLSIPPELDRIFLRAAAVLREDRYASAYALHEAIERFLDGDRDEATRGTAAAAAAAQAEALADASLAEGGSDAQRGEALRLAGRALVLDADNRVARGALGRLLLTPPRALPREVVDASRADDRAWRRDAARLALWASLPLLPLLSFLLGLDARLLVALLGVAALTPLGVTFALWRAREASGRELGRLRLLAWTLRQLVPEGARAVVEGDAEGDAASAVRPAADAPPDAPVERPEAAAAAERASRVTAIQGRPSTAGPSP